MDILATTFNVLHLVLKVTVGLLAGFFSFLATVL